MANKIEIIFADVYGFCPGIQRTVEIYEKSLKKYKKPIFSFGQIGHNPHLVKKFSDLGIVEIHKLSDISPNISKKKINLIISPHGAPKKIYKEAEKLNINLIDATCPLVKKIIDLGLKYQKKDYQIILYGKKNHQEILSILTFLNQAILIDKKENISSQIKNLSKKRKTVLLSQTTKNKKDFQSIATEIKKYFTNLIVENTICDASFIRQNGVRKLAKKTKLIIIIGGKNSSNSKELVNVGIESGAKTYLVEKISDLKKEWFINQKKLGISAGASTPKESIAEITTWIKENIK